MPIIGGAIIIDVSEDGAGVELGEDPPKSYRTRPAARRRQNCQRQRSHDLIFQAGFSTAETGQRSLRSRGGHGRVRRNIKNLGGTIEVLSEAGHGTTFTIRLPLTLAILEGQLVRVGQETYIVPLVSISESLQIDPANGQYRG